MDIRVVSQKIFLGEKFIGVVANDGVWLVDFYKLRHEIGAEIVKGRSCRFCQFNSKASSLEYFGAIKPKYIAGLNIEYCPIFIDRDKKIAFLADLIVPLEELELVLNPMIIENTFLVFPKFAVVPIQTTPSYTKPLIINSETQLSTIYPAWTNGEQIEFQRDKAQYAVIDTSITALNCEVLVEKERIKINISNLTFF